MSQTQSSEIAKVSDQADNKPTDQDQDTRFYTDDLNNMLHFNLSTLGLCASLILQTALVLEGIHYNVDHKHIGTTVSVGIAIQIMTYMALSKLYTQLSSKYGNKIMAIYGAFSFLLGSLLCLVPILSEFYVSQFLLSNGFTALYTVPFDVEDEPDRTKGEAAAFSTSSIFVSALFAAVIIAALNYKSVPLSYINAIISIIVFLCVTLNSVGLTSENLSHEELEAFENNDSAKDIVKGNGWLIILTIMKASQNICFIGFFVFSTLYYHSILPNTLADPKGLIFFFYLIMLLISNLCLRVYAKNLDKENQGITMGLALVVPMGGALSWILTSLAKTYPDRKLLLAGLFIAVAMPGCFVIGDYIYRKNVQLKDRLSIRRYLTRVQLMPAVLLVLAVGFLYDNWRKDAPLFIMSGLLVTSAFIVKKVQSIITDNKKND